MYSSAIGFLLFTIMIVIYLFCSMQLSGVFIPLYDCNANLIFSHVDGYLGSFQYFVIINHTAITILILSLKRKCRSSQGLYLIWGGYTLQGQFMSISPLPDFPNTFPVKAPVCTPTHILILTLTALGPFAKLSNLYQSEVSELLCCFNLYCPEVVQFHIYWLFSFPPLWTATFLLSGLTF